MVEKLVKDARNEARLVDNLYAKTSKALSVIKKKNKELSMKLAVEERGRRSSEAGFKNAQDQAEEQRKELYYAE